MRISFDLDDTLIPGSITFPIEKQNVFQKLLGVEPLRDGAVRLLRQLSAEGNSICIYTTSFRKPFTIRFAFWTYGICLNRVINQTRHEDVLKGNRNLSSKYPPAFNIDLHVDDSRGVGMEGQRFKFNTVIIGDNENWVDQIHYALQATLIDSKTDRNKL